MSRLAKVRSEKCEIRIYKTWLEHKYFHAERQEGKKTYLIYGLFTCLNITVSFMGHALKQYSLGYADKDITVWQATVPLGSSTDRVNSHGRPKW